MKRILISDLPKHVDKKVTVQGWVKIIRNQKRMQFLIIRDHSGFVQSVNERGINIDTATLIDTLSTESAVEISGLLVLSNIANLGYELQIKKLIIHNMAKTPLPINLDTQQEDLRLDNRFLDIRLDLKKALIFRIQTAVEHAMRLFWKRNHFTELHSPKLMGSPSESGAELFEVDYFDRKAYLAQSPQFYKQMAMAAGLDRVFEIGPVFRANPSFTSRHDTEFISVDCEISWIKSHYDIMKWEERWLHFILAYINKNFGEEIKGVFGTKVVVPKIPFPKITIKEAYQILSDMDYEVPRASKGDLDPEGERRISQYVMSKYGHEFVFVTDYPTSVRPFYHMRHENNPILTKSFDLLWKGLEVTTGAQREHRSEILLSQIKEKGLTLEPIKYYFECFKYGCPPHGGYGFGLTRMLMLLLGFNNVREVTFLYRGPKRLFP